MGGWSFLWLLAAPLMVAGIVVVLASMFRVFANDDDALHILRARFARGEIDAEEFARSKLALGTTQSRHRAPRTLLLVATALLIAGWLAAGLASSIVGGPGGMMAGMMRMMGPVPTAPPGTSVTMAGARFTPATMSIKIGDTVRWFNDDAMPHTVTAPNRAWDSGNLAPGDSFERRFDSGGTYSYVCLYHSWMTGTVVVSST